MSITTIVGPMFSGKTSHLVNLIDRHLISQKKCIIIKHTHDTRYDNNIHSTPHHITTHSNHVFTKCEIACVNTLQDLEIPYIAMKYQTVGIEEGFLYPDLVEFCISLANKGVDIVVSTIDTDYRQRVFNNVATLLAHSEHVVKLLAVCGKCNNYSACYTIKHQDNGQQIEIGTSDIYQSVCRKCLPAHV